MNWTTLFDILLIIIISILIRILANSEYYDIHDAVLTIAIGIITLAIVLRPLISNKSYKVKIYNNSGLAQLVRKTHGSVGYDICASTNVIIPPRSFAKIPTGVFMDPSQEIEIHCRPRSGLASMGILGYWGTMDPDYRGECFVLLYNFTDKEVVIERGTRVAQIVFNEYVLPEIKFVDSKDKLSKTSRGEQGWGSTGLK